MDALDELFSGDDKSQQAGRRLLDTLAGFDRNPMDVLPDDVLVGWCQQQPNTRFTLAVSVARLYRRADEKSPYEWTALAQTLLAKAPDPVAMISELGQRMARSEGGWRGAFATDLEARLKLFEQLDIGDIPQGSAAFARAKKNLKTRIELERRTEQALDRMSSGTFE